MEKEAKAESVQTKVDTVSEPVQEPSVDANARLLDESKKYKERAQQAEKQLREIQQKQLEESKNWQAAYEKTKAEAETLRRNWVKASINSGVRDAAAKAGCVSVDALLKLGNREKLSLDEESGEVFGVEDFVDAAKKDHPYLFKTQSAPVINAASPGGMTRSKGPLSAADIVRMPAGPEKNKLLVEVYKAQEKRR